MLLPTEKINAELKELGRKISFVTSQTTTSLDFLEYLPRWQQDKRHSGNMTTMAVPLIDKIFEIL